MAFFFINSFSHYTAFFELFFKILTKKQTELIPNDSFVAFQLKMKYLIVKEKKEMES